ncbi:MAG: class I SAM-dependent methyltransferase [Methanomassiliicoccus sp.]|nr:class I SAM-dependent methyltransferase [Methanomassiliicoccus sp.]
MSPNNDRMYWGRRLQDNPVGEYRPHEALIEAVASGMMPGGRALVLSNDDGIDALFLAQSGYSVALVGFFPAEMDIARQRIAETDAKVQIYVTEPTKMPFHEGEFDVVFDPRTWVSLQGGERDLFVKEIYRMTRPGSYIVLVVPTYRDSPVGCMTRQTATNIFQPPFEVQGVTDVGGVEGTALRFMYSIMMKRP